MATLGKTNIGATPRALNGTARGLRLTMPEAAATGFSVWAYLTDSATGDNFRAALISDSDKITTLAASAIRTDISTAGWYEFTGSDFDTYEPANGETFVVIIASNSAASATVNFDDDGATYDGYAASNGITTFDPLALTSPGMGTDAARDYSVYLEYTAASAGGGTPSHFMGFGGRMIG